MDVAESHTLFLCVSCLAAAWCWSIRGLEKMKQDERKEVRPGSCKSEDETHASIKGVRKKSARNVQKRKVENGRGE